MLKIEDVLAKLDHVKPQHNGWVARCPAHEDRSPSLHITGGTALILLHCFAGCSFEAICAALHVKPTDLFYDDDLPTNTTRLEKLRRQKRIDAYREADRVIAAGTHLDLEAMPLELVDLCLAKVCDAREVLLVEAWEQLKAEQYEEQIIQAMMQAHTTTPHGVPGA